MVVRQTTFLFLQLKLYDMKNLSSIFIFVIILLQAYPTTACTCGVNWSFCETTNTATTVVEVEVLSKYDDLNNGFQMMDIKILETFQNGVIEDTLTVSANGLFCDEYLGVYNVEDKLVVNFTSLYIDTTSITNYPIIRFSSCYTNVLTLNQNEVIGFISPDLNSQNYDDFKNNLTTCNDLIASNDELDFLKNEITISPNPFSENINIDFGKIETSDISLEVFSPQGQTIFSNKIFQQDIYKFSLDAFPAGIYFLRIRVEDVFIIKRIIKM